MMYGWPSMKFFCFISSLHLNICNSVEHHPPWGILSHNKTILLQSVLSNLSKLFLMYFPISDPDAGHWNHPAFITIIFLTIHILLAFKSDLKQSIQKIRMVDIWWMRRAFKSSRHTLVQIKHFWYLNYFSHDQGL